MTQKETIQALLDEATRKLLEHCDSVRIFVTAQAMDGSTDETSALEHGGGNFYAQMGQVQEWLCIQKQFQKNEADRRDERNDES